MITQFDVFNKMPKDSIDIFMHTGGGRSLGKKHNNNAIIEMLVDNETFQNFAFQQTYGGPKSGKKEKFFIMYAVDRDEYEKQLSLLNKLNAVQGDENKKDY